MDTALKIKDIIKLKELDNCGRLLFPPELDESDLELTLDKIAPLFPQHSHIDANTTLAVIDFLRESAKKQKKFFFDLYSEEEKALDPLKKDTGLFFLRGASCAPFALLCPGGGYSYIGSLIDSFPLAMKLSRYGYNVFVLHYRLDRFAASEDLALALTLIFDTNFDVYIDKNCYSLWGSSNGADVSAYIASYGAQAFGGKKLPRPGALVMQYSAHKNHTRQEPPTFVCVGAKDPLCDLAIIQHRIDSLNNCGIDTELHIYPNLGHGFGLGVGTEAEGWFDCAEAFWRRHVPSRARRVLKSARGSSNKI